MWISYLANYMVFGIPLPVILLCGILGVLVDIDHLISALWAPGHDARFLHKYVLLVGCLILCVAVACIGGLLRTLGLI